MLTAADREVRAKRLGASEVPAVLGLSPWAGPMDPWARLMHSVEREPSPELVAGQYIERAVYDWHADTADVTGVGPGCSMVHPRLDWLSATPDGIATTATGPIGIECKTARSRDNWGEPGSGEIPVYYAAQVQTQMAVCGFPRVHVPVLFTQSYEFALYVVERDDAVIDVILGQLGAWWERHIVRGEMPALDGGNAASEVLRRMFPHSSGVMAEATPEQAALVQEYSAAKDRETEAKDAAAVLRQRLILEIGERDGLVLPAGGRVTYRESKTGTRSLRLSGLKDK